MLKDLRYRDWRRWVRAGWSLGAGFAALSLFIAISVIFYAQQQWSDHVVRRALRIEVALGDVFSGIQDAEVGQRGYLLVGDEDFLQPYRRGTERLATHMAELSTFVAPIKSLKQPLTDLKALVAAKQTEMAQTIELYQSGHTDAALALVRGGTGRVLMDQIRTVIAAMDAHEDSVVEARQAEVQRTGLTVAVSTTAAVVLLAIVTLVAMREVIRRSELSRFMPAEVADRLASGDLSLRHGQEMPAAIVFVDIRGSTELAERMDVAQLSMLLSWFRGDVLAAARANGGLVDKFIGDGALVVFGVHDTTGSAAAQALAFARDLRQRHQSARAKDTGGSYGIGIGIHYGTVFCGIVGAAGRLEFTVLGDTVNVAARLEKETRTHGVDLLVSDAVLRSAAEQPGGWREVCCDGLRGRRAPLTLFAERSPAAA